MKSPNNTYLIENQKRFDYYAFISYKHLDKRWAKWVQKQLEYYRLPNQLCKAHSTPKHIMPVFRDETDLAGGKNVKDHLLDKINRSKYLIVICSRNMQTSPKYIDYEIESFLAAGNPSSRILPLIVDGEANSRDPEKECLPPALKAMGEDMPLGITMNHKRRKDTVLKLIASILELELSSLRSHDQERKNRRIIASLCGGLAASLALGGFIAWEGLKVKQAGMREQLTYAEDTFRQGDRLSAARQTTAVEADYLPLMDQEILENAQELKLLSAIHPKYRPVVSLAPVTADSRLLFTADGAYVMVITDNTVQKFDMQGRSVMHYEVSQHAHRIVDVCADGIHAAVVSFYLPGLEGSHLWLWNMENDTAVCELVSSTAYDQNDARMGYLGGVVDAAFSPDGSLVCAWRDGDGYYNQNDELAAWNAQTGEKLFSFSGELLGKMNQPYEVEAFEFIGSDTLHWTGSSNHVFYTLGDEAPVAIPKNRMPRKVSGGAQKEWSLTHMRYTMACDAESGLVTLTDLAAGNMLEIPGATECIYVEGGSKLLLFGNHEGESHSLWQVDLPTLSLDSCIEDFAAVCRGKSLTSADYLPGSPYLYLTLDNSELYRLTLTDGTWLPIGVGGAAAYTPIAHTGTTDVLAASFGGKTGLLEVEGTKVRRYIIDERIDALSETAVFSATHMAMAHNGSYFLYPREHPGTALEAGLPAGSGVYTAAGYGGRVVVQGSGNELRIWNGEALSASLTLNDAVCGVWVGSDTVLALTETELLRYDVSGSLLRSTAPAEGQLFCSFKASKDGSRILVLSKEDALFGNRPYHLTLLNGSDLSLIARVSDRVHAASSSAYEIAYDLSGDGKWIGAVERVSEEGEEQYQLSTGVFSGKDGSLLAQSQSINNAEVPVFDLIGVANGIASAYRQQYVTFGAGDTMLSGLQYGTWIFDLAAMETRSFLSEGTNCDALPVLMSDGRLLYPASGLHVWDTLKGKLEVTLAHTVAETDINAMLKPENQNRLYLSSDEKWLVFTGAEDTWLYRTDDWSRQTVLAAQPCRILYLDSTLLIYNTPDGLFRFELP